VRWRAGLCSTSSLPRLPDPAQTSITESRFICVHGDVELTHLRQDNMTLLFQAVRTWRVLSSLVDAERRGRQAGSRGVKLTWRSRDSVIDVCGCIFIRGTRTPPANEACFVGSDRPSGTYIASIGRSHLHIYAFYKRQLRSLAITGSNLTGVDNLRAIGSLTIARGHNAWHRGARGALMMHSP